MKSHSAFLASAALTALLVAASARAQSAVPDDRPGAGAITGPSMGSNPPLPSDPDAGTNVHRPAGDAPERQTGPTEDDQGTGVLEDENPSRPAPGRDMMGNEPGTGTGNMPRSNDPPDAGD